MENSKELSVLEEINVNLPQYRGKIQYFNKKQLKDRILKKKYSFSPKVLAEVKEDEITEIVKSLTADIELFHFDSPTSGEYILSTFFQKNKGFSFEDFVLLPEEESEIKENFYRDYEAFKNAEVVYHLTNHFRINWINKENDVNNNHAVSKEVVKLTGEYLEESLIAFQKVFKRVENLIEEHGANYNGRRVIEVEIAEFDESHILGATYPNIPILLNANLLNEDILPDYTKLKTTIAHELFHKVLYTYGHQRDWGSDDKSNWLVEGLAAWAETFVYNRVNSDDKLWTLLKYPSFSFFDARESAILFWLFFDNFQNETEKGILIERFLELCYNEKTTKQALVKFLGGRKKFNEFLFSFVQFKIIKAKKFIKKKLILRNPSYDPIQTRGLNNIFFKEELHIIDPLENDFYKFSLTNNLLNELQIVEVVLEEKKAQLRIIAIENGRVNEIKKRKIRNKWLYRHRIDLSRFEDRGVLNIVIFRIEEENYNESLTYENIMIN